MFRFSKRFDYGLLFLLSLADRRGRLTPLDQIAKAKKISAKFLSQIAADLSRAGIVKSKEGKGGGYLLAKELDQIPLSELIRVLEKQPHFTGCGLGEVCRREELCEVKRPLQSLEQEVSSIFASLTVADLIQERFRYD